jgi:hypothetical protein
VPPVYFELNDLHEKKGFRSEFILRINCIISGNGKTDDNIEKNVRINDLVLNF